MTPFSLGAAGGGGGTGTPVQTGTVSVSARVTVTVAGQSPLAPRSVPLRKSPNSRKPFDHSLRVSPRCHIFRNREIALDPPRILA